MTSASHRTSTVSEMNIPIYVPNERNEVSVQVAKGKLQGKQLVLDLEDTLAGEAIRRMLHRGTMMGLSFVAFRSSPNVEDEQGKDENTAGEIVVSEESSDNDEE